ncbi:hypothetical protein AVE30378_02539 [Achromobacter veterisilvae]|uniref:Uncharacterized protein n=1 Tax=Achromobacter veterisilvae TaxID=2069367 RepID=A0A446CHK9_9BURK|nr:hypothetical protein [Achromobacter veterisilvae]SSW67275.1 hypothetical protein AVE30378_02539 [Achromobacter veterisilvae]
MIELKMPAPLTPPDCDLRVALRVVERALQDALQAPNIAQGAREAA